MLVVVAMVITVSSLEPDGRLKFLSAAGQRVRSAAPDRLAGVADAASQFAARGGQWEPSATVKRRIEQTALGRLKCSRLSPT
jgi:hypothetical protein